MFSGSERRALEWAENLRWYENARQNSVLRIWEEWEPEAGAWGTGRVQWLGGIHLSWPFISCFHHSSPSCVWLGREGETAVLAVLCDSRTRFSCSFLPLFFFFSRMNKPIPGCQEHSGVRAGIMCEEIAEQVFFSPSSFTSASCSCQHKICIQYT